MYLLGKIWSIRLFDKRKPLIFRNDSREYIYFYPNLLPMADEKTTQKRLENRLNPNISLNRLNMKNRLQDLLQLLLLVGLLSSMSTSLQSQAFDFFYPGPDTFYLDGACEATFDFDGFPPNRQLQCRR
jgi:hypothetical protein